jgi:hypothetical protein
MDEVMKLRHFLERSETAAPDLTEKATHWLLVIDHHEARIFRSEMGDALPQRLLSYEPGRYFRHAPDSKATSKGKEKPDPNTFFEPVARVLQAAGLILIFGTGTGTSSEMEQFCGWLKQHHPETSKKIIGSIVVDEHHLTEGQLLAKAKDFYSQARATSADDKPVV